MSFQIKSDEKQQHQAESSGLPPSGRRNKDKERDDHQKDRNKNGGSISSRDRNGSRDKHRRKDMSKNVSQANEINTEDGTDCIESEGTKTRKRSQEGYSHSVRSHSKRLDQKSGESSASDDNSKSSKSVSKMTPEQDKENSGSGGKMNSPSNIKGVDRHYLDVTSGKDDTGSKVGLSKEEPTASTINKIAENPGFFTGDRSATLPRERKDIDCSSGQSVRDAFFGGSTATVTDQSNQIRNTSLQSLGSQCKLTYKENVTGIPHTAVYAARPCLHDHPHQFDPRMQQYHQRFPVSQQMITQINPSLINPSSLNLPAMYLSQPVSGQNITTRPTIPAGAYYTSRPPMYPVMGARRGPSPVGSLERIYPGGYVSSPRFPAGYVMRSPVSLPTSPAKKQQKTDLVEDKDKEWTTVETQTSFHSPSLRSSPSLGSQKSLKPIPKDLPIAPVPVNTGTKHSISREASIEHKDIQSKGDIDSEHCVEGRLETVPAITTQSKFAKPPFTRSTTSRSPTHPLDKVPGEDHTLLSPSFSNTADAAPLPLSPASPRSPSGRKLSRKNALFNYDVLKNAFCLSCPPVGLDFQSSVAIKCPPAEDGEGGREMIGFATLPEQVHRKTVKRGFDFTLLVVGESGLGKSTLVNSLFLTELYKDRKIPTVESLVKKTVEIEKKTVEIEEKGVKLRLTVVDTPGFGDGVDCADDWKSVERYVDEQFNKFFQDESGLNRRNIQDHRVHCCLYFVPPYGHGLRQLDTEFMKRLHRKVNIVPVIAKADTLTKQEITRLKANLLRDIEAHKIKIYQFPDCDEDEDEEFQQQDRELKASIPFAVIGSNCVIEVAGRRVRGRQYPWGIVEVENAAHCDFVKLRTMLISTHMQDMKEVTQDVHYENFRAQCISQMHVALKERNKLRRDSISLPETKGGTEAPVMEDPGRLLEQKDEEIRRMQEMLSQMQQRLQGQDVAPPPAKPPKKSQAGPGPPISRSKPSLEGNSPRDSVINV